AAHDRDGFAPSRCGNPARLRRRPRGGSRDRRHLRHRPARHRAGTRSGADRTRHGTRTGGLAEQRARRPRRGFYPGGAPPPGPPPRDLWKYSVGLTFSSKTGVRKPHAAIYQDALAKVGVDPSRTLFVGDRVREDVRGPKSLGMRAVLTREFRQEDDPGVADFVIDRFGELPTVLNRLAAGTQRADTYNDVTSRE